MKKNRPSDIFKFINMHGGNRTPCWEWLGTRNDKGMPYFTCNGKKHVAYRYVYELVHGPLPAKGIPRHTCDHGSGRTEFVCCNPWHMQEGSHQDNMDDMADRYRHGLSFYVVRAIRTLYGKGISPKEISERFGIGEQTTRDIVSGKTHGTHNRKASTTEKE